MRKFTKKAELVRHGVTRFATAFLTLQRLHNQKHNLRKMFTSEEWSKSKLAKERKGKLVTSIVLNPNFWYDVVYSLKAMVPLFKVLRLVDNEKKPAMGYIYEAMDRAKETIQKSFKENVAKYTDIIEIIDRRWESQLHHPLHAAGHYLNHQHYFSDTNIENDSEVVTGLMATIERLCESPEIVDKTIHELAHYKTSSGLFGIPSAIRGRSAMHPAMWWGMFGSQTSNLQKLAIKVLSLTCSSSGCERNWSVFEQIHSKKRNRLEHQKLQDVVYIKYNQALKERFDCCDTIDPIVLNDIDDANEWLTGDLGEDEDNAEDDLVFEGDDLTWDLVGSASGANEPTTYTRQQTRLRTTSQPSSSRMNYKGKAVMIEEDDQSYKSSSDYENDEEVEYVDEDDD